MCFLFSGEKFPTLTSHREGPFFTLNFRISQNNHILLYFASYNIGFSPICPRRPGEGWEPSGGGFAPLHRPFGRPAFFMAGPRVTEVSLSGSTRRLSYSVFKVPCGLWQKLTRSFSVPGVTGCHGTGRVCHGWMSTLDSCKQDTADFRLTEVTESTGHRYSWYHLDSECISCR